MKNFEPKPTCHFCLFPHSRAFAFISGCLLLLLEPRNVKLLNLFNLWPPFGTAVGAHVAMHYSLPAGRAKRVAIAAALPGITSSNIVVVKFPWLDRAEAAGLVRGCTPAVFVRVRRVANRCSAKRRD